MEGEGVEAGGVGGRGGGGGRGERERERERDRQTDRQRQRERDCVRARKCSYARLDVGVCQCMPADVQTTDKCMPVFVTVRAGTPIKPAI